MFAYVLASAAEAILGNLSASMSNYKSRDTSKICEYFNISKAALHFGFHVVYQKIALFFTICLQKSGKRINKLQSRNREGNLIQMEEVSWYLKNKESTRS